MRVENSLEFVGSFLEELFPLGFEELQAFTSHNAVMHLFQFVGSCDTLLELWVVDHSCDRYFDGLD